MIVKVDVITAKIASKEGIVACIGAKDARHERMVPTYKKSCENMRQLSI